MPSNLEAKLADLGYTLPVPFTYPSPNRTGCVLAGNIAFVSGHGIGLPQLPDVVNSGKLGVDVSDAQGYATARAVMLSILASLKQEFGSLDRIKRVIRLFGMVNCSPEFAGHAHIIDGASDLLYALLGPEYGCHARSAVGMTSLPRQIAVEINGEFEITPP
jgi:enamine deaminase RidA (YjgF/YER057c/UK114 family)